MNQIALASNRGTPDALAELGLRTVLIGTRETVGALAQSLKAGAPLVRHAGAILVEDRDARAPGPRLNLGGTPVLGGLSSLPDAHRVLGFTLAILCLPRSMRLEAQAARARLNELGIALRELTPIGEQLEAGGPPTRGVRAGGAEIDAADLIGRVPYGIDRRAVAKILEGKRVLVTGAGGSIGSELVRIAATFAPEQVILMERSENALFEIDRQLARRHPGVRRRAMLHDVVDEGATRAMLADLRPHVVFHAAAHKHVPLMEDHPSHAVTNNLFGTKSIADAAIACGAERFVLISSDKAVNPTSVMGATKRLAEMYVQHLGDVGTSTHLSMVRFGNVLGSAGSVLPIWGAQVAEGGPLTVTDPRMTRYFMTIHEAATLVIQSAAMDLGAPEAAVFVLDMGEPIRILDLARRFVSLHGYHPRVANEVDRSDAGDGPTLDIVFSGARPGEKLHEELAYAAEHLIPTPHPGIRAWGRVGRAVDGAAMIAEMSKVRGLSDRNAVLAAIRRHVPEMCAQPLADTPPSVEILSESKQSNKKSTRAA